MKRLILLILLFVFNYSFGQIQMSQPYEPSKANKLSTDAYVVFKTNKFLDFKDHDYLVEKLNDSILKKTDLNNFFEDKKDWAKVEKEDTTTIKMLNQTNNAKYVHNGNTMIETYNEFGYYNVQKTITTVYNPKGFILSKEKKYYVGDNYNRTESIINEYDNQNRVVKITNRIDRNNKKDNEESIIQVEYGNNRMKIISENGTMICEFIKDENSIGFVSKLNSGEVFERFMYAIQNQQFDTAKEYCTHKMSNDLLQNFILNKPLIKINWLGGTDTYSLDKVQKKEVWEITFATNEKKKYNVEGILIKQKNGWKIDDFKIY